MRRREASGCRTADYRPADHRHCGKRGGVGSVGELGRPAEIGQMALTGKMKKWADAYLVTLNKTEAARRAGYGGSEADLSNIGYQNYRKLEVQAYLKDKLDEMAMPANEVLARLSEQASADMSDFLKFEDGVKLPFLDLKTANEKGLLRLVKKFKYNAEGHPEVELYDAQAALVHLGKAHGLFAERVEHTGPEGGPIQFTQIIVEVPNDAVED